MLKDSIVARQQVELIIAMFDVVNGRVPRISWERVHLGEMATILNA